MQVHVGRNNQQLGTFTVPQILSGLASGQFLPTDLAWHDGLDDWMPLSALAILSQAPPEPVKKIQPPAAKPEFVLPKIERKELPPSKAKAWLIRIAVFAVMLALAIPLARVGEEKLIAARSVASAASVVEACNRYADQHGGSYPPDLKVLIMDRFVSDEKALSCPLGNDDEGIGWEYFGNGVKKSTAPDKVIVISKAANESGRRVIGTADGKAAMHMMPLLPKAK